MVQDGSGFVRDKAISGPTVAKAKEVAIDTRVASAPADILSKHKPYLHKITPKNPVESENGG